MRRPCPQLVKLLAAAAAVCASAASQGIITTVAGTDWIFTGNGKPAVAAPIGAPLGLAVDRDGNVFVADQLNHMVMKVNPAGTLTVVAGNGLPGFSGDGGPAVSASLRGPQDVAVDAIGNLFIADNQNARIRKVAPDGVIFTLAGNGRFGFSGDGGPAIAASLNSPQSLSLDDSGNFFIGDNGNFRVRKVNSDGVISTVAGNGQFGFSGDGGPATDAAFGRITGVAVDAAGNLYIADWENSRIRKVGRDGAVSTVAGDGRATFSGDGGPAVNASVRFPVRVIADGSGNLYIADWSNERVRRVSPNGIITTVVGNGQESSSGDGGPGRTASLSRPYGLALDATGSLYIGEQNGGRVRKVTAAGIISTFAGNGGFQASAEGSPGVLAVLNRPKSIFLDAAGNLYIAEQSGHKIRKLGPGGKIFSVAGVGIATCSGNGGPALASYIASPSDIAADAAGDIYFSEGCHVIRRVRRDGTLAGTAGMPARGGFSGDGGPATAALLNEPDGITFDRAGNLYIADRGNDRVRKVTPDGIISTVAGNGQRGFSGDGGPAANASLNYPSGLALDRAGNLYITDTNNHRIRMVTPDGNIFPVAGNGRAGFTGDGGPAINASLNGPRRMRVDAAGNLFIADFGNHRIRMVAPNGIITSVAGNGLRGLSGDGGPPAAASLGFPADVAVDSAGSIYIADYENDRIRVVSNISPSFQASPASLAFSARSRGAATRPLTLTLSSSSAGLPFTISAATTSGGPWLRPNPASGLMPATVEITADPGDLAAGTYQGLLTISAPGASPSSRTVAVSFRVEAGEAPRLAVELAGLSFTFTRRSGSASSQLAVSNRGSGTLSFTASASTSTGGGWLSVAGAAGTVGAGATAAVTVTANPAGLDPGTYAGRIIISSSTTGETIEVPVTMTISAVQQTILLSQTGLTFTAVARGGTPPPQTFGVLNTGQGAMSWSVRASTLAGGTGWLTVRPDSGSTDAGSLAIPLVEVGVQPGGLAPGSYYGEVQILAAAADNSPQSVSVVLNVLPPGSNPGPVVRPTGLIFAGLAGGSNPGSEDVLISNITGSPLGYASNPLTYDGARWFVHVPGNGVVAPDQPARIVVQPDIGALPAGVRRGVLTLLFQDGLVRTVNLLLVVAPSRGGGIRSMRPAQAACAPAALLPLFTSLGTDFAVPAGWPVPLDVRVVDDCGAPMVAGSVVASFSSGDPPVSLVGLKDGRWSGTWQARNAQQPQVTVTVAAEMAAPKIQGRAQVTGGLQGNANPPVLSPGGVVSAASLTPQAPLAPGSIVSIFGARLSEGRGGATRLPLENQLAGAQVSLAGRPLPLLFASDGQINALVPWDIPVNARLQMIVRRGTSLSVPEAVVAAPAQPAIFTRDQSGKGQGLIYSASGVLADAAAPVRAGEAVVIYCSGLGAVDPAVGPGAAAGAEPLSRTVGPVAVTIGGRRAEVFFAGLTPGFAGLYQVNAFVPEGVGPGDAVVVGLGVAGQSSPTVWMAVR